MYSVRIRSYRQCFSISLNNCLYTEVEVFTADTSRAESIKAAILQTTFSNVFSWMKICKFWLNFHRGVFQQVQLTVSHQWSRLDWQKTADKPVSELLMTTFTNINCVCNINNRSAKHWILIKIWKLLMHNNFHMKWSVLDITYLLISVRKSAHFLLVLSTLCEYVISVTIIGTHTNSHTIS